MKDTRRDFVSALRKVDEAFAERTVSSDLHRRVRERLVLDTYSLGRYVRAIPLAVLGMAIGALVYARLPAAVDPAVAPEPTRDIVFEPASCLSREPSPHLHLFAGCRANLGTPAATIYALTEARLEYRADGVRLRRGKIAFNISAAERGDPFVVQVSAGRIEVFSARVTVRQDANGHGSAELQQGRITFVDRSEKGKHFAASDVVTWGPDERSSSRRWAAERIEREVRLVTRLRADGQYDRAAEKLEQLLKAPIGRKVAAVLSYERAELLEQKLKDRRGACRQFQRHRARFGHDRYAAAVDRALARCRGGNFDVSQE